MEHNFNSIIARLMTKLQAVQSFDSKGGLSKDKYYFSQSKPSDIEYLEQGQNFVLEPIIDAIIEICDATASEVGNGLSELEKKDMRACLMDTISDTVAAYSSEAQRTRCDIW